METKPEKLMLYALCFGCPEGEPLKNCFLKQHREGSVLKNLKEIENYTLETANKMLSKHRQCLLKRYESKMVVRKGQASLQDNFQWKENFSEN